MTRAPKVPDLYQRQPRCAICKNVALLPWVDSQLAKAMSAPYISKTATETMNMPVSIQIVRSHAKHYVPAIPAQASTPEDLAILVRDRTVQALKTGTLEPTISHGLQAQQILDRRAEKTNDRETMLNMARLLSGAGAAGFLAPPEMVVIEGESERISEE